MFYFNILLFGILIFCLLQIAVQNNFLSKINKIIDVGTSLKPEDDRDDLKDEVKELLLITKELLKSFGTNKELGKLITKITAIQSILNRYQAESYAYTSSKNETNTVVHGQNIISIAKIEFEFKQESVGLKKMKDTFYRDKNSMYLVVILILTYAIYTIVKQNP
jgi:hypothetical protein